MPFHDRKAGDIHRLEIHDRLQDIKRAHGGIMANRALACVRKAYSFGVRSGSVEGNPALLVDAPAEEADRDRVYNEDEIRALWKAFDDCGVHGAVFQFCLVTGQRLGEVSGLSRAEISDGIWELTGVRTKNGLDHVVPLSNLAQQK